MCGLQSDIALQSLLTQLDGPVQPVEFHAQMIQSPWRSTRQSTAVPYTVYGNQSANHPMLQK